MRLIIHEQPTEKPLAAGALRYEQNGRATGAVETWRLTRAAAGYEVLRVDLDARAAPSGHTYLYHFLRQENGRPERLKFRFWGEVTGEKWQVVGDVVFTETGLTAYRTVNDETVERELDLPPGYLFWFPATIGLAPAVNATGPQPQPAVFLDGRVGADTFLALQQTELAATMMLTDAVPVQVGRKTVQAVPFQVTWADQQRTVLRETHGWPVGMERAAPDGDGLLAAVATRYILY